MAQHSPSNPGGAPQFPGLVGTAPNRVNSRIPNDFLSSSTPALEECRIPASARLPLSLSNSTTPAGDDTSSWQGIRPHARTSSSAHTHSEETFENADIANCSGDESARGGTWKRSNTAVALPQASSFVPAVPPSVRSAVTGWKKAQVSLAEEEASASTNSFCGAVPPLKVITLTEKREQPIAPDGLREPPPITLLSPSVSPPPTQLDRIVIEIEDGHVVCASRTGLLQLILCHTVDVVPHASVNVAALRQVAPAQGSGSEAKQKKKGAEGDDYREYINPLKDAAALLKDKDSGSSAVSADPRDEGRLTLHDLTPDVMDVNFLYILALTYEYVFSIDELFDCCVSMLADEPVLGYWSLVTVPQPAEQQATPTTSPRESYRCILTLVPGVPLAAAASQLARPAAKGGAGSGIAHNKSPFRPWRPTTPTHAERSDVADVSTSAVSSIDLPYMSSTPTASPPCLTRHARNAPARPSAQTGSALGVTRVVRPAVCEDPAENYAPLPGMELDVPPGMELATPQAGKERPPRPPPKPWLRKKSLSNPNMELSLLTPARSSPHGEVVAASVVLGDETWVDPQDTAKGLFEFVNDEHTIQALISPRPKGQQPDVAPRLRKDYHTIAGGMQFAARTGSGSGGTSRVTSQTAKLRVVNFMKRWIQYNGQTLRLNKNGAKNKMMACFDILRQKDVHPNLIGHLEGIYEIVMEERREVKETVPPPLTPSARSLDFFMHFPPHELAQELTLMQFKLFSSIPHHEFLKKRFEKAPESPHLREFVSMFNCLNTWVALTILQCPVVNLRYLYIQRFLEISATLARLKNFAGQAAIVLGLQHGAVIRLKNTWKLLSSKENKQFEELGQLVDTKQKNFQNYRAVISGASPPFVPFLAVSTKDITAMEEVPTLDVNDNINIRKLRILWEVVDKLISAQKSTYDVPSNSMIYGCIMRWMDDCRGADQDYLYLLSEEAEPRIVPPLSPGYSPHDRAGPTLAPSELPGLYFGTLSPRRRKEKDKDKKKKKDSTPPTQSAPLERRNCSDLARPVDPSARPDSSAELSLPLPPEPKPETAAQIMQRLEALTGFCLDGDTSNLPWVRDLIALSDLRDKGVLTDDEFSDEKRKLLARKEEESKRRREEERERGLRLRLKEALDSAIITQEEYNQQLKKLLLGI
mmetsp:Transcript_3749/g.9134  ORF Transcript_3749/g.9134 Transcript_3749/m.9134 type:complete len:1156 (+) Transcript_3749:247-3714(+)